MGLTGPVNYWPFWYAPIIAVRESKGYLQLEDIFGTPAPAPNNKLGTIFANMFLDARSAEMEAGVHETQRGGLG